MTDSFSQLYAVDYTNATPIGYSATLPSAPITYTPADPIQQAVYTLLVNNNAFNTAPAVNATQLNTIINDLTYILIYISGINSNVKTLAAAADQASALQNHIDYHYANIIDNLQLVSSGISDAIGYGVIGTAGAPAGSITDPTASYSDFFGSITGKSDMYVAQAANQIVALVAHACALVAGAIILSVQAESDTRIITALGTLTTYSALVAVLGDLTQTNLNLLGTALTNLGTLFASGDPSLASLSSVYAIAVSFNLAEYVTPSNTGTPTDGG